MEGAWLDKLTLAMAESALSSSTRRATEVMGVTSICDVILVVS